MKRKTIISIILSAILVSSVSIGLAAEKLTTITAQLNHSIKINLNGQSWTPKDPPITYNGTTYLPVRAVAEAVGLNVGWDATTQTISIGESYDALVYFPADKYPQTAAHIASAILSGKSAICTIDRDGADANREASLAGIPTREGYDRDEWPMAMCEEGGAGASVAYVESSDNRGAGAWVGNALEKYPDGTRVKFIVSYSELKGEASQDVNAATNQNTGTTQDIQPNTNGAVFNSCAEAKAAGAAPLYRGSPGYSAKLDRDGDGIACEN